MKDQIGIKVKKKSMDKIFNTYAEGVGVPLVYFYLVALGPRVVGSNKLGS